MAVFNLIGLTTYSAGTCARAVFTITCTIVFGGALLNSNYHTISHYAPEFEESKSAWLSRYGETTTSKVQTYVMMSRSGVLYWLLNLRIFARFIAAIELLRVGVRAVSLSLRLIANLSCGHILLTLYSDNLISSFRANVYGLVDSIDGFIVNLIARDILLMHVIGLTVVVSVVVWLFGAPSFTVFNADSELTVMAVFALIVVLVYGVPSVVLFCGLLLRVLETVVAIVQAYVFLTLATSYLQ